MQQLEAHHIPKCSFSTFIVHVLIFVEKGVDAIPERASQFTLETIQRICKQERKTHVFFYCVEMCYLQFWWHERPDVPFLPISKQTTI